MSTTKLTATSYLVLGIVARRGRSTPYDLKRYVKRSIGFFWTFPHAQLYSEPKRLADLGLLREEREEGGRHRHFYTITEAGSSALRDWLQEPISGNLEIRDPGLLKLFFGDLVTPDEIEAIAKEQQKTHLDRLAEYENIHRRYGQREELRYQLATLRMGILFEEASLAFWREIGQQPDGKP